MRKSLVQHRRGPQHVAAGVSSNEGVDQFAIETVTQTGLCSFARKGHSVRKPILGETLRDWPRVAHGTKKLRPGRAPQYMDKKCDPEESGGGSRFLHEMGPLRIYGAEDAVLERHVSRRI